LNPDFTFQMREQVSLKRQDKNSGGWIQILPSKWGSTFLRNARTRIMEVESRFYLPNEGSRFLRNACKFYRTIRPHIPDKSKPTLKLPEY
jgi:hypothetical protein